MPDFLDILCIISVVLGLLFFLGASIGLLRFPDFYTRMHAAGKGDTLSTLLIMFGVGVYEFHQLDPSASAVLVIIKILAIGTFVMLTSPTSTHALMKAGYDDEIDLVGDRDEMVIEMPKLAGALEPKPAPEAPVVAEAEKKKKPAKAKKKAKAPAKKKKQATAKKKAPRRKKD